MSLLRQQYIVIIQCEAPAAEMVSMVRQRDMSLAELCLYSGATTSNGQPPSHNWSRYVYAYKNWLKNYGGPLINGESPNQVIWQEITQNFE